MTEFKEGDRVRIARQPSNQWVQLVGEVGLIEEIRGGLCNIQTFSTNGTSGWGTVPLDCLEPYRSPLLEQKIAERQADLDRVRRQCEARQRDWQKLVGDTAAEFSLPTDTVATILRRGREWRDQG